MATAIRTYLKAKKNILSCNANTKASGISSTFRRSFSDDKNRSNPQFSNSTIMVEHGYNVQELPVLVRTLTDLSEIYDKPIVDTEPSRISNDSQNYNLIKSEFSQCLDLRDVFTLLSKCTKITPSIALGAIERIYTLEKNPTQNVHVNLAKGAILDKLLKVVTKTKDTQTIINILNTTSTFMEPYKPKFSEEIMLRVLENMLSVEQICEFLKFLILKRGDQQYSEIIDKLWIGFVQREADINETNISKLFSVLPGFKASKRTVLNLSEQKLSEYWNKITVSVMQQILDVFIQEKYLSVQSFAVIGRWLHTNIHALNDDEMLDIISKLTQLKYTDDQIEIAVEKYIKLKGNKINMHVLIVGILNYCMQFHIRNDEILNACSKHFFNQGSTIPAGFLRSVLYPFGYFNFKPLHEQFWSFAEDVVLQNLNKMTSDDICSIILSFIYVSKYPLKLTKRIFSSEYLINVKSSDTLKKLHLIDTALSIECPNYLGPLMPKDQYLQPISQDFRVKNLINKILVDIEWVAGGKQNVSTSILVPHFCSDQTYLIDIMLHPPGLNCSKSDWLSKYDKDKTRAILIHLPDDFCTDNKNLIGPQLMRRKHLQIIGLNVTSLSYSLLSQFYTSHNTNGLRDYIKNSLGDADK